MKQKSRVYFMRHGITPMNLQRKYIGIRSNPPITDESKALIEKRVEAGIVPEIKTLWVSPMKRARQTAALYFPEHEAIIDKNVAERDFGDWDGHTWEELKDIELYREFIDTRGQVTPSGGESYEQYRQRLNSILQKIRDLMKRNPEAFPLAIVCHAGPIRYWTSKILPQEHELHCFSIDGAGCLAVDFSTKDFSVLQASNYFAEE